MEKWAFYASRRAAVTSWSPRNRRQEAADEAEDERQDGALHHERMGDLEAKVTGPSCPTSCPGGGSR